MAAPLDIGLQLRVENLLALIAACLDDGRFEEWPGFFTANCVYRIVSAENHERGFPLGVIDCDSRAMLEDRITALREANVYEDHRYRHILSTTLVKGREDGLILAETAYQVVRIMRDGSATLFSVGRYLDRILDDAGELRLAERLVVFDNKRIDTLLAIPL
jgi:3-phenylpropionate/cinnamic acid dioxygenase small subunit